MKILIYKKKKNKIYLPYLSRKIRTILFVFHTEAIVKRKNNLNRFIKIHIPISVIFLIVIRKNGSRIRSRGIPFPFPFHSARERELPGRLLLMIGIEQRDVRIVLGTTLQATVPLRFQILGFLLLGRSQERLFVPVDPILFRVSLILSIRGR